MDHETRLKAILQSLPPGTAWRPVRDLAGNVLAEGTGLGEDGLSEYLPSINFSGKTVCDLGCNLGYFSFMAARGGAVRVTGLDVDPLVVEGAGILAAMQGFDNMRFQVSDFLRQPPEELYDVVLVIDFIGRGTIVKGRLDAVLDSAAARAREKIVFTLRPVYPLEDLAGGAPGDLAKRYGDDFVHHGRFHLLDYVQNYLPDFAATQLTPPGDPARRFKHAVKFIKI
jgi:ribosomal protein L11 methyltransferase